MICHLLERTGYDSTVKFWTHLFLLKKNNPNPQNIILETIKQDDEMDISEISDDVDFI